LAEYADISI
jgi:calcium-dependent protein kinase